MNPTHLCYRLKRVFAASAGRPSVAAIAVASSLALLWMAEPAAAQAIEAKAAGTSASKLVYEGEAFERSALVSGNELRLNGLGVRQVAWFKAYLAALYLSQPASTAAQAMAAPAAKRIHLRMLHDVPAVEFSKAVRKGMERNVAAGQASVLQERMERFVKQIDALGKVRKRDAVDLDYDPARGLVMSINGATQGEPIAGDDFYAALLRSFVGSVPYDEKMRDGLLGKP